MSDLETLRKKAMESTQKKLQKSLTNDQLIIQANNMVNDLHKINNALSKRLREWAGGWVPELEHEIEDHEQFVSELSEANYSNGVGTPIPETDSKVIKETAKKVKELYELRNQLNNYIEESLSKIAPSLVALCGGSIAADLLKLAGSLERLAKLPSSTIQLLGAETALFRHLKNKRHDPPKHGIIFNHQLIQRAKRKDRGRIARSLADKISIAVRVDYFKGEPIGNKLREQLEAKFK